MGKSDSFDIIFDLQENYLGVVVSGNNLDFISLIKVTRLIYDELMKTQSEYLVIDFIGVKLNVSWSDTFNIVKQYDLAMPEFKHVSVAFVYPDNSFDYVQYWQKVATERGYTIDLFATCDEAKKWLEGMN